MIRVSLPPQFTRSLIRGRCCTAIATCASLPSQFAPYLLCGSLLHSVHHATPLRYSRAVLWLRGRLCLHSARCILFVCPVAVAAGTQPPSCAPRPPVPPQRALHSVGVSRGCRYRHTVTFVCSAAPQHALHFIRVPCSCRCRHIATFVCSAAVCAPTARAVFYWCAP